MRPFVGSIVILVPILAGCLGGPEPSGLSLSPVVFRDGAFVMDLPIHVVAVGFESFSEANLMEKLRQPMQPFKLSRAYKTGDFTPEPLQYRLLYQVHVAPDSFAEALFAFAKTVSRKDAPDQFLIDYDLNGRNRICAPGTAAAAALPLGLQVQRTPVDHPGGPCEDIERIDAVAIERWIADHRAEYGLDFGKPGYSIFFLDSYSKGYLPRDSYHQYEIVDGTADRLVKNMRAWGGDHNFIYVDTAAGPNEADVFPWAIISRAGHRMGARLDLPVWSFDKFDRSTFYSNLAQHTYDAARMLWARSPIFPIEYAEKYVLPFYVFIDPNARANPKSPLAGMDSSNLEKRTDFEGMRRAFQELVPWAQVEVRPKFVHLPDDDPALAAALSDAKRRYTTGTVDFGVVKKYFRENWDDYAPEVLGARVYPTFAFWLEFPSNDLNAWADADERGNSFGVFVNIADAILCLRPEQVVCSPKDLFEDEETWWRKWNAVLIHELGHSFGLTHSHDTNGIDGDGYATYERNWLFSSTSSVMSYRHTLPGFSSFDREFVLRAHAVALALDVIDDGGRNSQEALQLAFRSLDEVRLGDYPEGLALAQDALEASRLPTVREERRMPGETAHYLVRIPGSSAMVGQPPKPLGITGPGIGQWEGLTFAEVPLVIPDGATSVDIEYREADAPTHLHWRSDAVVVNGTGVPVVYLLYNAHDKVELANLKRCSDGCRIRVQSHSGINLSYEIAVTAYFE